MAATKENKVKAGVKKILERLKIWYFAPMMNGYGRAGIPDFVCCFNGRFLGIECKADTNDVTALQARELKAIHDHGGFTYIARESNLPELEAKLRWLSNSK